MSKVCPRVEAITEYLAGKRTVVQECRLEARIICLMARQQGCKTDSSERSLKVPAVLRPLLLDRCDGSRPDSLDLVRESVTGESEDKPE